MPAMNRVDIAVIGGGIQGCGVAQAAAAAGYSVVLVEKGEIGGGTSGNSSKLIHGGLRYLRQGEYRLVRESLRERDILLRIAPTLVELNRFHIPVYRDSRIRPWQLRIGLGLYALLSGGNPLTAMGSHRHNLDGLRQDGLQGVFSYQDAQTDDRLLTLAVARSAQQLGARIHTATRAVLCRRDEEGYALSVQRPEGLRVIHCRVLVNAAGPWVNLVADHLVPEPPKLAVELVKGSHLVLGRPVSGQCYYLESPHDGRPVFALPWRGGTLLGTTEIPWQGDPDAVGTTPWEEDYLLRTLTRYFPDYRVTPADIQGRMAGLRVLPAEEIGPSRRSREVQIVSDLDGASGYVAIYGGKLTGYRATAAKVLDRLKPVLGKRKAVADTARLEIGQGLEIGVQQG